MTTNDEIHLRRTRRPNGRVRTYVSKGGKEIGYVDRYMAPSSRGWERVAHAAYGYPHPQANRLGSFDTRREAVEAIVAHAAKPREPRAEGQFATLDEERELFDLINFGGLPQGEVDDDM